VPAPAKLVAQALAVAGLAALLGLLVWKVAHQEGGVAPRVAEGERVAAPDFTLSRLDAEGELSLRSLRGQVVVLNFWQSTCPPCVDEAPAFQRAWEKYRRAGVVFVGVDFWDLDSDARRFLERHGVTYPQLYDGPGKTLEPYGVVGAPETFFIDRRGRIVGHARGELSEDELIARLEEILTA
jgi:cytochrome c biogenesis protein CcmG, thiol:disulfide interchange protein DsbE